MKYSKILLFMILALFSSLAFAIGLEDTEIKIKSLSLDSDSFVGVDSIDVDSVSPAKVEGLFVALNAANTSNVHNEIMVKFRQNPKLSILPSSNPTILKMKMSDCGFTIVDI